MLNAGVLRAQVLMVAAAALLYLLAEFANTWLFAQLQHVPGITWVYLPAGMRLVCVLLFGGAGALGMMLGGYAMGWWYYFPGDLVHTVAAGTLSAAGPYLVYRVARWRYGLHASLGGLTARRLLVLALACSATTPLLHHLWRFGAGRPSDLHGLGVMFVGDLLGTFLVLYGIRTLLVLVPRRDA